MSPLPSNSIRTFVKRWLPPIVLNAIRSWRSGPPRLRVSPDAELLWELDSSWDSEEVLRAELTGGKWQDFAERVSSSRPLGFSHEMPELGSGEDLHCHNVHMTYGYIFGRVLSEVPQPSILDYGGALGHYALLARGLFPSAVFRYHVLEVPIQAHAGSKLFSKEPVSFFSEESQLDRDYDLVMLNASMQYFQDWELALGRALTKSRRYFLLARVPTVEGPGFVAVQRAYGKEMPHRQFNSNEILSAATRLGAKVVREFVVGDRVPISGHPKPAEMRTWLFRCDGAH
jgi:putative methyltransferase (TIGR04325 family)